MTVLGLDFRFPTKISMHVNPGFLGDPVRALSTQGLGFKVLGLRDPKDPSL